MLMKRTKPRLITAFTLLVLLLGFIWGNSAMPGQTSGQLSGWVGDFLQSILPFLDLGTGLGKTILRKLAHFSEFAALGICLGWIFGMLKPSFPLPWLCGTAVACVDEIIQIFSPGRYPSIVDVGIDSAGVLTGVSVLLLLCWLIKKRKK